MDTLRWIIISVLVAILLGYFLIKFFYHHYKTKNKRIIGINVKTKCAVENCESWYKNQNYKYCQFHTKISQLHEELKKLNSPLQNKASMYMSSSARFYNDSSRTENAIKELEQEIEKNKKKLY